MTFEDKIDVLKKSRCCFRCAGKHMGADCKIPVNNCSVCQRNHVDILCRDYKAKERVREPQSNKPRKEETVTNVNTGSNLSCTSDVALQTVMVKIDTGKRCKTVRAFLDTGSQRSYILRETAKELRLEPVNEERVVHNLFGGQRSATLSHSKYCVNLLSVDKKFNLECEICDHHTLCGGIPKVLENNGFIRAWLQSRGILIEEHGQTSNIELMIGADLYGSIVTGKVEKMGNGVAAIETEFGWTVIGPIGNISENIANATISMYVSEATICQLWEMDVLGIREPIADISSKEQEKIFCKNYAENISKDQEGRYVVKLPWKEDKPFLPDNRDVALKRLKRESDKLQANGLFVAYHQIFQHWKQEGFIESVDPNNSAKTVHYLPHRPVVKLESSTTPVRPVFDASCHVGRNPSLNDCQYKGVNLIQFIPSVFLQFRLHRIGFVADIRKAFQMIGVYVRDRDVMRFLWWADENMDTIIVYRHARVMFGGTSSPFILAAVLYYHIKNLNECEKKFGERLLETLYVDNCASSEDTIESYHLFREKSIQILSDAKMDLRCWYSNVEDLEDNETKVINALGLKWDRCRDELSVKVPKLSFPDKITKRVVLAGVQKIYDPIGFVCPALLPMKILLQQLWARKLKWDEELPTEYTEVFRKWSNELKGLENIKVPRMITGAVTDRSKWEIHTFVDASLMAYGAVVFLRTCEGGMISVQLVAAKSRVAPVKSPGLTTNKLELMGCVIGARLTNTVKRDLKLEGVKECYWTDSLVALAWISRDEKWTTFVGNRSIEIRRLTDVKNWRHVPGKMNPADLPSRGCSPSKLSSLKFHEGPSWLWGDEKTWKWDSQEQDESKINCEKEIVTWINQTETVSIISFRKQFRFMGYVRVIAWVRRFLFNKLVIDSTKRRKGQLSKIELSKAEFVFIQILQKEAFPENKRKDLAGLEIFLDDWKIIRVKSRLTYRDDPYDFKCPILLPGKSDYVKQLVKDYHLEFCHAGVGYLFTKLRKKYWITKTRRTINGVIAKCVKCQRFKAKEVIPNSAPLPLDRIKSAEVFQVVGVDLAGPLTLKTGTKTWMVIFTCGIYRAVHLELVSSVSTRVFLNALEKFIKKYRRPEVIYSDNGTNFRGADNLFRKLDWDAIGKDKAVERIIFKFNPASAPWYGGFWERLIRTTKDLMKKTIGRGNLTWKELERILESAADIMNARPLTHLNETTNDLETLTPAHFLHPLGNVKFPEKDVLNGNDLRYRLKHITSLQRDLKKRFVKEYLSLLVNRYSKVPTKPLLTGTIVLVGCDLKKRLDWPLGRVLEMIPGRDGSSRMARVKTEKGEIVRAVQRLYPLEFDNEDTKLSTQLREKLTVTRSGRRVKVPQFLN